MDKKIFFIDFDQTLLCDDKSVSRRNKAALKEAVKAGHYVTLATGRAIASAKVLAEELELTGRGCFLIAYNGSLIYDFENDKVLGRNTLPVEYARYIYREATREGLYIQGYDDNQVLACAKTKEMEFYCARNRMQCVIAPDEESMFKTDPPKMLIINLDSHDRLVKFHNDHLEWENGKCKSFFSDPAYLEYCPLNTSKGTGLLFLESYLGLPHEATVAVGDEENDIPMIKEAFTGFAMKNAIPKAKEAADLITENDNNHDAIAEIVEKMTGIKV